MNKYLNSEKTIGSLESGDFITIVEPGHCLWEGFVESNPLPYSLPVVDYAGPVRNQRNTLLSSSDWTQVADAPVDKAAWATYRQELRDITAQAGFPTEVIWPVKPE